MDENYLKEILKLIKERQQLNSDIECIERYYPVMPDKLQISTINGEFFANKYHMNDECFTKYHVCDIKREDLLVFKDILVQRLAEVDQKLTDSYIKEPPEPEPEPIDPDPSEPESELRPIEESVE